MLSAPFAAIALLLLFLCGPPLRMGAAVSLRDVLTELGSRFEKGGGPRVDWAFGSSGQLVAQVRQGAPLDGLIVASREIADILESEKLVEPGNFIAIAGNRLVLAAPHSSQSPPTGFLDLANPRTKRIAIGDPATVPVGDYAMQAIVHLSLAEQVKHKLVFGTNARQVLAYLSRDEVDAAIIFSTDAALEAATVRVLEVADERWHKPIEYLASPLKGSKHAPNAARFIQTICSEEPQHFLAEKGFVPRSQMGTASSQPTSARSETPQTQSTTRPAGAAP